MHTSCRTAGTAAGGGAPACNADGALCNSWQHLIDVHDLCDVLGHVQALEARKGQQGGAAVALLQLAQAGLRVQDKTDAGACRACSSEDGCARTHPCSSTLLCCLTPPPEPSHFHASTAPVVCCGHCRSWTVLQNLKETPVLLLLRTCTLPRKLTTLRWGYLASSCAWRRRLAEPTTAPSGSSLRSFATGLMNTSRTSSRGRLQGRTVPSGR